MLESSAWKRRRRLGSGRAVAIACALSGLTFGSTLVAQQVIFRSRTMALAIDVQVLDRDGMPVADLVADDFEIKVDGQVRPVFDASFLRAVDERGPAATPIKLSAGNFDVSSARFTNAGDRGEPRVFVILYDDLSITPGAARGLTYAAKTFVENLLPTDLAGFETTSGAPPINPTRERSAILKVLSRTVGQFLDIRREFPEFVGVTEALMIHDGHVGLLRNVIARACNLPVGPSFDQLIVTSYCASRVNDRVRSIAMQSRRKTENQIAAFIAVIDAMRHVDGIKHLVIMTGGIGVGNNSGDFARVARAAVNAGVQMSVLAEEPDLTDVSESSLVSQAARVEDDRALMRGAQTMADMSGGQFYRVIGQADRAYTRIAASASAVYRLGVELPPGMPPGTELGIGVRVKRKGVAVFASRFAVAPDIGDSVENRLRTAVTSGVEFRELPMEFSTTVRGGTEAVDINVSITIRAATPGSVTGTFGLVDAAGKVQAGTWSAEGVSGDRYRVSLPLRTVPGRYTLRVAGADAQGAMGSVEGEVDASLRPMGPLRSSDILLWWVNDKGERRLEGGSELPGGIDTLHASVELSGETNGGVPVVTFELMSLDGTASPGANRGHVVPAVADAGVLRADAVLALKDLAAGMYGLRATVTLLGTQIGQLTTTFHK